MDEATGRHPETYVPVWEAKTYVPILKTYVPV
jgi:hypothetical protein